MGRPAPVVVVGARGKQERDNALRAEQRVHILADGSEDHPIGMQGDCPNCPLALAQGDARRRHAWLAR
jgi:hypothetical protein